MKKERIFITDAFLAKIGKTGSLAEAAERLKLKDWRKCKPRPQMSTWSLVCEEVVDTTYSDDEYEDIVAELYRRGLVDSEIIKMREFAWRTAGYLNFEMAAWDWCSLDEKDIARSIGYLEERGEITSSERMAMGNIYSSTWPRTEMALRQAQDDGLGSENQGRPPVRVAHPDNELSGPPETDRRTECNGYLLL